MAYKPKEKTEGEGNACKFVAFVVKREGSVSSNPESDEGRSNSGYQNRRNRKKIKFADD